jgi:hypothetical protein
MIVIFAAILVDSVSMVAAAQESSSKMPIPRGNTVI